jgi:hypothetical protein
VRSPFASKLAIDPGNEAYGIALTSDQGQYGNYVQIGVLGRNMDILQGRLLFNLHTSNTDLKFAGYDFRLADKSLFYISGEGNVGIGTITRNPPTARLQIEGGPKWTTDGYKRGVMLGMQDAVVFGSTGYKFGVGANGASLNFFASLQESNAQTQAIMSLQPTSVTIEGDLIVKGNVYSNGSGQVQRQQQQSNYNSQSLIPPVFSPWKQSGNGIAFLEGNVSIGSNSPSASKLHVAGEIFTTQGIRFADGSVLTSARINAVAAAAPPVWTALGSGAAFYQGNIGIGTQTTGSYKLAVEGGIGARKVVVTQQQWADYVFAEDYPLAPLDHVEKEIKQRKHLPGIPSAKEVETEGLDLGGMQAKMMEKIEELTLYVIDLHKKNRAQEELLISLTDRIARLEAEKK